MSKNDEEIQKFIGEVPDQIGSFAGIEITQDLDKKTLFALIHWLTKDMENTRERHKDHIQFLADIH